MVFGAVGMCLLTSAVELLVVFIALEISSISTYILAGYRKQTGRGPEAAIKYFLLGSFATAFLLYGIALIFGATGTTQIYEIAHLVPAAQNQSLSSPRWRSCWSEYFSKFPLRHSTCGRPMFTKARLRRWSRSCPPRPKRPPSHCCCASSTRCFPSLRSLWAPLLWSLPCSP